MSSPIYIKTNVNDQPTEGIVDTGSAISIIHLDFLKTIQHNKFIPQHHTCRTANATPLNLIGQIQLEIKVKHVKTSINTYVATNLITPILLGNDWINPNHVHLFGDQQRLTIPDQHGELISIPYMEPNCFNYPALLVNQITLPPHSQTLVDITSPITNTNDLIFEPYERHISKLILIPHALLNINNNKAKVVLINAQNRPHTLPKNTRIGTISRDATFSIYTTIQNPTEQQSFSNQKRKYLSKKINVMKPRAVSYTEDNSKQITTDIYCEECKEYFLSGNDLQKHLRAECYSEEI